MFESPGVFELGVSWSTILTSLVSNARKPLKIVASSGVPSPALPNVAPRGKTSASRRRRSAVPALRQISEVSVRRGLANASRCPSSPAVSAHHESYKFAAWHSESSRFELPVVCLAIERTVISEGFDQALAPTGDSTSATGASAPPTASHSL